MIICCSKYALYPLYPSSWYIFYHFSPFYEKFLGWQKLNLETIEANSQDFSPLLDWAGQSNTIKVYWDKKKRFIQISSKYFINWKPKEQIKDTKLINQLKLNINTLRLTENIIIIFHRKTLSLVGGINNYWLAGWINLIFTSRERKLY